MAIRIIDGDILSVNANSITYKVDLALTYAPSRTEEGFVKSTEFTRDLCLGSTVLVDQDDKLLISSADPNIIAAVYTAHQAISTVNFWIMVTPSLTRSSVQQASSLMSLG
ncbi:MAG: hypothetical protein M3299_01545 [Thermoproteota archaeon]|nr:hypothetical protein [Thermoproteota archaeon]